MGFVSNLEGTFLEGNAVHSLDAAILYLPMGFPLFLSWLAAPISLDDSCRDNYWKSPVVWSMAC